MHKDSIISVNTKNDHLKQIKDTIFIDINLEETAKYGYQFGMTLSEWNKNMAVQAQNNILKELSETTSFLSRNIFIVDGSYKGFKPFGDMNDSDGFYLVGLFQKPNNSSDSVIIIRRQGRIITEPFLIGIQKEFNVHVSNLPTLIEVIHNNKNFNYFLGPSPIIPNTNPLTLEDFKDPFDIKYDTENKTHSSPYRSDINAQNISRTLYKGEDCYQLLEVAEKKSANIGFDETNKMIDLKFPKKDYIVTLKMISKKTYPLNIKEYMTSEQFQEYQNSKKTKELIDKVLKK